MPFVFSHYLEIYLCVCASTFMCTCCVCVYIHVCCCVCVSTSICVCSLYVYIYVCVPWSTHGSQDYFWGVDSLLPPCVSHNSAELYFRPAGPQASWFSCLCLPFTLECQDCRWKPPHVSFCHFWWLNLGYQAGMANTFLSAESSHQPFSLLGWYEDQT